MSIHRRLLGLRAALIARRTLFWAAFGLCATMLAAGVLVSATGAQRAAARWGVTVPVIVTLDAVAPGDLLDAVERRHYPLAMVPAGHLSELPADAVADHHLAAGQILSTTSLGMERTARARVRDGDVAVTISEQLPSGAHAGDRVIVTSQGTILVDDAIVLESQPPTIVLSVPRELGPLVAAAGNGELALLVHP